MIFEDKLSRLISYNTIANAIEENNVAVDFITNLLAKLGFRCSVAGNSKYGQPCIIAEREPMNDGRGSVVLYGHYDIEKVKDISKWHTDPYTLTEIENRYFAVGIADNKGPLMARIQAVENLLVNNEPCPEILWLIQGEEEVGSEIAHKIFKEPMRDSKAILFVDETAYHKEKVQEFLIGKKNDTILSIINHLGNLLSLEDTSYDIQIRSLNKSFTPGSCPFLNNIPQEKMYFSFGPNDKKSNIHRSNESLDINYLKHHIQQFSEFLKYISKENI